MKILIAILLFASCTTDLSSFIKDDPPPMVRDMSHYNDTLWLDSGTYFTNLVITRRPGAVIFVPMPWDTLKYKP